MSLYVGTEQRSNHVRSPNTIDEHWNDAVQCVHLEMFLFSQCRVEKKKQKFILSTATLVSHSSQHSHCMSS